MPKVTKHPRLRRHVRKGRDKQVYTYYYYDMRPEGKPDIFLSKDYAEALAKWDELYHHKPRTIGRLREAFERWRDKILPAYQNAETRTAYAKQLRRLDAVLGGMTWDDVTLPILREYLDRRFVKQAEGDNSPPKLAATQGNREMSLLSIVWGKARLWGMTKLPWPAAGVKNWKNKENEREFQVTDELFAAVYAEADALLRDCMDIASATGMRLTDVRTVRLPVNGKLTFNANKTSKGGVFDVAASPVLSAIVDRREALNAHCVMLLCTHTGRKVSENMLSDRWDAARERAADKAAKGGNAEFADLIRAMFLRDMRSRAADLATDVQEASKLLQHSSLSVTKKHYRTRPEKLHAVR